MTKSNTKHQEAVAEVPTEWRRIVLEEDSEGHVRPVALAPVTATPESLRSGHAPAPSPSSQASPIPSPPVNPPPASPPGSGAPSSSAPSSPPASPPAASVPPTASAPSPAPGGRSFASAPPQRSAPAPAPPRQAPAFSSRGATPPPSFASPPASTPHPAAPPPPPPPSSPAFEPQASGTDQRRNNARIRDDIPAEWQDIFMAEAQPLQQSATAPSDTEKLSLHEQDDFSERTLPGISLPQFYEGDAEPEASLLEREEPGTDPASLSATDWDDNFATSSLEEFPFAAPPDATGNAPQGARSVPLVVPEPNPSVAEQGPPPGVLSPRSPQGANGSHPASSFHAQGGPEGASGYGEEAAPASQSDSPLEVSLTVTDLEDGDDGEVTNVTAAPVAPPQAQQAVSFTQAPPPQAAPSPTASSQAHAASENWPPADDLSTDMQAHTLPELGESDEITDELEELGEETNELEGVAEHSQEEEDMGEVTSVVAIPRPPPPPAEAKRPVSSAQSAALKSPPSAIRTPSSPAASGASGTPPSPAAPDAGGAPWDSLLSLQQQMMKQMEKVASVLDNGVVISPAQAMLNDLIALYDFIDQRMNALRELGGSIDSRWQELAAVHSRLVSILAQHGLSPIDFAEMENDPSTYRVTQEVITTRPDENGQFARLLRQGFRLQGKVYRHAEVEIKRFPSRH